MTRRERALAAAEAREEQARRQADALQQMRADEEAARALAAEDDGDFLILAGMA